MFLQLGLTEFSELQPRFLILGTMLRETRGRCCAPLDLHTTEMRTVPRNWRWHCWRAVRFYSWWWTRNPFLPHCNQCSVINILAPSSTQQVIPANTLAIVFLCRLKSASAEQHHSVHSITFLAEDGLLDCSGIRNQNTVLLSVLALITDDVSRMCISLMLCLFAKTAATSTALKRPPFAGTTKEYTISRCQHSYSANTHKQRPANSHALHSLSRTQFDSKVSSLGTHGRPQYRLKRSPHTAVMFCKLLLRRGGAP